MRTASSLLFILVAGTAHAQTFDQKALASMGAGLYGQTGANSCSYCHGIKGSGGNIAVAANLTHPKTWKSYKGLGGDAAFAKNKVEFLDHLKKSVTDLIRTGAVIHNAQFKEPYFDWKKSGQFNGQMLGLTGAPSKAWLDKYKSRGVTPAVAADAAYQFIQSFDKDGVFK